MPQRTPLDNNMTMRSESELRHAEEVFHYVAPVVVLIYYFVTAMVSVCTLQTIKSKYQKGPKKFILAITALIMLTYVGRPKVFARRGTNTDLLVCRFYATNQSILPSWARLCFST